MTPNDDHAFPVPDTRHPNGEITYGSTGMTLRDWFATHASEADIHVFREFPPASYGGTTPPPKYTREQARYRFADAMLEARR